MNYTHFTIAFNYFFTFFPIYKYIPNKEIKMDGCKVISEICCNHGGDINVAKEMIKMSKLCGADYAKFQKRNPIKAVPAHVQDKPHPCPMHSFGETYLEHRQNLEFSIEQHKELKEYCEDLGIGYSSSVWDEDSAREIISLNPDFIKIPSAMNENYKLLNLVFDNYDGDVHISFGMISKESSSKLKDYLYNKNSRIDNRVVVYQTTSSYPVPFESLFLNEIINLKKDFYRVGYSGHHLGIAADIAAATLGASWIERHFTLDRTARGTDHSASLEVNGLQKLCRDLKAVHKALQYKKDDFTDDERNNMEKLKIKS